MTQSSSQREEIIRLKQELQLLHRDLACSGNWDFIHVYPHLCFLLFTAVISLPLFNLINILISIILCIFKGII